MNATRDLDIAIDRNDLLTGIADIISEIRPNWLKDKIHIEEQQGGFLNIVLKVSEKSFSKNDEGAMIIKILTESSNLADHSFVKLFLKWITENIDGFVDLICCFKNGYVFKYYKGETPTAEDMKDNNLIRQLFKKLHILHQVTIPKEVLEKNVDSNLYFIEKTYQKVSAKNVKEIINGEKRLTEHGFNWDKVMGMIENTKTQYEKLVSENELVICHMDPRTDNMIFDRNSGEVSIVDWEFACASTEIIDICAIFFKDPTRKLEKAKVLPAINEKLFDSWLLMYLQTHPKLGSSADQAFPEWKEKVIVTLNIMYQYDLIVWINLMFTRDYENHLRLYLEVLAKWRRFQKIFKLE